jgi:CRP/FNR family cyclic AMP-dependent transcriptional regulator
MMSANDSAELSSGDLPGKDDKTAKEQLTDAAKRLAVEWIPFHRKQADEATLIKRALRSTPLFERVNRRDWKLISDLFHVRRYDAGEIIFEKGTPGLGMYVIVEGRVKIINEEEGHEVVLTELKEGDFFGEMSLIDEVERSAGAIANTQTKLVGLFRPQLRELMNHRPRLGNIIFERLAKIVVQRLRQSNLMMGEEIGRHRSELAKSKAEVETLAKTLEALNTSEGSE